MLKLLCIVHISHNDQNVGLKFCACGLDLVVDHGGSLGSKVVPRSLPAAPDPQKLQKRALKVTKKGAVCLFYGALL